MFIYIYIFMKSNAEGTRCIKDQNSRRYCLCHRYFLALIHGGRYFIMWPQLYQTQGTSAKRPWWIKRGRILVLCTTTRWWFCLTANKSVAIRRTAAADYFILTAITDFQEKRSTNAGRWGPEGWERVCTTYNI